VAIIVLSIIVWLIMSGIAYLVAKNVIQQKIGDVVSSLAVQVPKAIVRTGRQIGNLVGGGAAGAET
jgi:hypothetical protein